MEFNYLDFLKKIETKLTLLLNNNYLMSTFTNEQKENTKYPVTMSEFTLSDVHENKKNDCEDVCMCCGALSLTCLVCGFAGAYITWLVFSIIGMTEVSDQTLREDHCGSLLWRYVLTMAIMTWIQIGSAKSNKSDSDNNAVAACCGLGCAIVLVIAMACWGSYELWGRECSEDLKQYTLYTCAYTMVVYQWVIVGLFMIFGISLTLMGCCGTHQEEVIVENNELPYHNESSDAIRRAEKTLDENFDQV